MADPQSTTVVHDASSTVASVQAGVASTVGKVAGTNVPGSTTSWGTWTVRVLLFATGAAAGFLFLGGKAR